MTATHASTSPRTLAVADGDVRETAARSWSLTRNCSLSPRGVARAYALLCLFSLAVALGFAAVGVTVILVFTAIELAALGTAWLVWGRRVGEGDVVSLRGPSLHIDCQRGQTCSKVEWPSAWTRVVEEDACVRLSCGSRRLEVGSHVTWSRRHRFAEELRRAISSVPVGAPTATLAAAATSAYAPT